MRSTRKRTKARIPSAAILPLVFLVALGWDNHQQYYYCHAFVTPPRSQSRPSTVSSLPPLERLQLFKTFDRVIKGNNIQKEEATSSNGVSSVHADNLKRETASPTDNVNGNSNKIPFVIERLGARPKDQVFREIAEMCIAVFFNDGKTGRAMPPWKEVSLSYLRTIQMADLRRRRSRDINTNAMFVAYRVEEASSDAALSKPLILNLREVYNLKSLPGAADQTKDYIRSDVLGFCEVTMVPFGIGAPVSINPQQSLIVPALMDSNGNFYDDDMPNSPPTLSPAPARTNIMDRPVLTNLSVDMNARKSGVGSKLVDACEKTVSREWGKSEIVLEVEEDNVSASSWYQKRGYRVLFSDAISKRYDVSGLVVKKVRCTRQVLRKPLNNRSATQMATMSSTNNTIFSAKSPFDSFVGVGDALKRLKENMQQ